MNNVIDDIHSQNIDVKNREIFLHGQHGSFDDDPGVEYRMATTFIKNIRYLDSLKNEPIIIKASNRNSFFSLLSFFCSVLLPLSSQTLFI